MITLTTPVTFSAETNDSAGLAAARIDALNKHLQVVAVYGNNSSGVLAPSSSLPAKNVMFDVATGAIYVNGAPLGTKLTSAQIAAVELAFASFSKAVESELVSLGVFVGAVS